MFVLYHGLGGSSILAERFSLLSSSPQTSTNPPICASLSKTPPGRNTPLIIPAIEMQKLLFIFSTHRMRSSLDISKAQAGMSIFSCLKIRRLQPIAILPDVLIRSSLRRQDLLLKVHKLWMYWGPKIKGHSYHLLIQILIGFTVDYTIPTKKSP